MSSGLGWLQQEIVQALQTEAETFDRLGPLTNRYNTRSLLKHLSKKHGKGGPAIYDPRPDVDWWVNSSFQASFSRALHSLVRRGELIRVDAGSQLRHVGLPER